ncbi:outer membrane beta-barrel protein [Vibrio sp. RE86]|uniref:outer membrane beta-barrel protein n=1 Tax=Vibrio sp. RE86 TaxID=2607605 RepID=UPI0014934D5C|nr:outer membrane beta-barrel protein [Vibrio sp. RE86]NOH81958.1 outer membrane beta-barrel protein [Vibrio sp. RE86]
MKKSLLAVMITLAASSSAISSENSWRVSGGLGYGFNTDVSETQIESSLLDSGFDTDIDYPMSNGLGYSAWVGWQAHQNIILEAGYLNFGRRDVTVIGGTQGFDDALVDALPITGEGFAAAIRPTYEFVKDWSVYGRIGAMAWESTVEVDNARGNESGTDLLIGAGVEYQLADNWAASAGWDSVDMDGTRNHLVSMNISYLFGGGSDKSDALLVAASAPVVAQVQEPTIIAAEQNVNTDELQQVEPKPQVSIQQEVMDEVVEPRVAKVYFGFDSTTPSEALLTELDGLISQIGEESVIELKASSDTTGPAKYNDMLAKKRADYVVKYLDSKGVNSSQINVQILGEVEGYPLSEQRKVVLEIK